MGNVWITILHNQEPSAYAVGVFAMVCDALEVGRLDISLYSNPTYDTAAALCINHAWHDNEGRRYTPGQRIVIYSPSFMTRMDEQSGSPWAGIRVMAHEVGHHVVYWDNPDWASKAWDREQGADYYAGKALARLGAGRRELDKAYWGIDKYNGTKTHPPNYDSKKAIEAGWRKYSGGWNLPKGPTPSFFDPDKRWHLGET